MAATSPLRSAAAAPGRRSTLLASAVFYGGAASVGYAVSEPGDRDPDAVMHRADVAMYEIKRVAHRGRDRREA